MHPKLESILNDLSEEFQTNGITAAREFARKKNMSLKDGKEKVTVFLYAEAAKTTKDIDRTALSDHGAEVIKSTEKLMKASVPVGKLTEIANNVRGISFIKLPDKPVPQTVSEGVSVSGADIYHVAGFTGSGVKVAVIDLGFKYTSSAISNGELPDDTIMVNCTGSSCISTTFSSETEEEHGTAVAETVHDMTPDAKLYLIKIVDILDLKDAKDYCVNNDIKIVNHSVGWFNQNFYDGKCYNDNPDCTVDDAYTNGILWVNSAGNYAQTHYSATFTDSDADGWHNVSQVMLRLSKSRQWLMIKLRSV
jgi:subtilisin family serine protease